MPEYNNQLHVSVVWEQDDLERFAEDRGCVSVSEYIRTLIRQDRAQREHVAGPEP